MSPRVPLRVRVVAVMGVLAFLAAACQNPFAADEVRTVRAELPRSNNLFEGSDVRILGLRVGSVTRLDPLGPNVLVTMAIDPQYELPVDVRAIVSPTSLLGERYVQLAPPYLGGPTWPDGETIPVDRVTVPAEVDEVLASFERFLAGLDRETLADLVDVLAETLAGQGEGLNRLIDQGSTTVRVLADTSDDLNAVVSEMADLNATLATREEEIGAALENWSTVVRTISEESDEIVEGVDNLRRLTAEIRPLTEEHADRLVLDLETLTTALSTVDRNLARLGQTIYGGRILFEGAGRGFDFENARLRLDNEGAPLTQAILLRLSERLVGVCLRLDLVACQELDFWLDRLPEILCDEDVITCQPTQADVRNALAEALGLLGPEVVEQLAQEQAAREVQPQAQDAGPPAGGDVQQPAPPVPEPTPGPSLLDRLPLPDPRIEQAEEEPRLLDRLARMLGGDR